VRRHSRSHHFRLTTHIRVGFDLAVFLLEAVVEVGAVVGY
jgi:hypothetical protein